MKCSLRIINFGFLISVIVAVLIIGKSLDASAQGSEVKCPCKYFASVPMTTECWTDKFDDVPTYNEEVPNGVEICSTGNASLGSLVLLQISNATDPQLTNVCQIISNVGGGCVRSGKYTTL
jgi:hypothetical protein